MSTSEVKLVAQNKKARHDYFIEETLECGINLRGNEVKSIKAGKMAISESWIEIKNGEFILKNSFVVKWGSANIFDVDEHRDRKLLAHKSEISKWAKKIALDGYTIVPLKVYCTNGKCKIEIGLAKGKHNYDKRQTIKERDITRKLNKKSYEF